MVVVGQSPQMSSVVVGDPEAVLQSSQTLRVDGLTGVVVVVVVDPPMGPTPCPWDVVVVVVVDWPMGPTPFPPVVVVVFGK